GQPVLERAASGERDRPGRQRQPAPTRFPIHIVIISVRYMRRRVFSQGGQRAPALAYGSYYQTCSMRYPCHVGAWPDWRGRCLLGPAGPGLVRLGREPGMLSSVALHAGELLAVALFAGAACMAVMAAGVVWLRRRVRRRLQGLGRVVAGRAR